MKCVCSAHMCPELLAAGHVVIEQQSDRALKKRVVCWKNDTAGRDGKLS